MIKFNVINFMYFFIFIVAQMSFDNASLEQLVELSNLIYDENDTVEVFLVMNDYNEQTTRESLIEVIKEGVHDLKYDGNYDDFNAIYWFVKGIIELNAIYW